MIKLPKCFRYEAFKARCLLAAMDHNEHTTLEQAITKTTRQPRFHRKFNKNSQQWTVRKVKERKQYNHVTGIIHTIAKKRMEEEESTHRHTVFLQQNPNTLLKLLLQLVHHQLLIWQKGSVVGQVQFRLPHHSCATTMTAIVFVNTAVVLYCCITDINV